MRSVRQTSDYRARDIHISSRSNRNREIQLTLTRKSEQLYFSCRHNEMNLIKNGMIRFGGEKVLK